MKWRHIIYCFFFCFCAPAQEQLDVFFDFDRFNINQEAQHQLENWLATSKDIEVTKIYGYCDWKGSNTYNDALSLQRVQSVYNFLKSKNTTIRPDYEVKGFGEDFEQSRVQAINRKVTIVYTKIIPIPPPIAPVLFTLSEEVKAAKPGDIIRLKNMNFLNNSAVMVPKSKPVLVDLLCVLEENPKLKIEIQGHICCQLQKDINGISTARARAVYVYLLRNKIDRRRISFKGFGITKPIHKIPEKSEAEEDENRRVEIKILEN